MLGPVIGQGGFGYIYLGGKADGGNITDANGSYVIKVEPHANGPLFVEMAFYQRVAKSDMITGWMKENKKKHIGVPLYIATGSFDHNGTKYRFLVMDRFGTDIEKIYKENDFVFPEETVFSLGLRIIDALEYMHAKEYVHADIKSSNIMLGYAKTSKLKVYLLDYGLAYRYKPGGTHVTYKEDPKRRHDGTIEYTSRDAHKGCAPSRRGDLEILGYCMLQWLCKKLPWEKHLNDKEYVMKEKEKYMSDIPKLMKECFPDQTSSNNLKDYLNYITTLEYDEEPDYELVRKLFKAALKKISCTDDGASIIMPQQSPGRKRSLAAKSPSPKKKRTSQSPKKAVVDKPPAAKRSRAKAKAQTSPEKKPAPKQPSPRKRTTTPKQILKDKATNPSGGEQREIHKRLRRRNVPTRDFGQSP